MTFQLEDDPLIYNNQTEGRISHLTSLRLDVDGRVLQGYIRRFSLSTGLV